MKKRVRRFSSLTDDFYNGGEGYSLPEDYKWVRTDWVSRALSAVIYGVALVVAVVYCRLFLHVRIKGAEKLKVAKGTGCFVYGNHTQPVGDVFIPALACFPKRIYTVVSPANMTLPVIGKILPYLGALPLPDSLSGMRQFTSAVEHRLEQNKCVVIYPEAHVWDYCTFIRPFTDAPFKYPVKFGKPVFCMTATYQKRRLGSRPLATVYIDGPFEADADRSERQRAVQLRDAVCDCMTERSRLSNCRYIEYIDCSSQDEN